MHFIKNLTTVLGIGALSALFWGFAEDIIVMKYVGRITLWSTVLLSLYIFLSKEQKQSLRAYLVLIVWSIFIWGGIHGIITGDFFVLLALILLLCPLLLALDYTPTKGIFRGRFRLQHSELTGLVVSVIGGASVYELGAYATRYEYFMLMTTILLIILLSNVFTRRTIHHLSKEIRVQLFFYSRSLLGVRIIVRSLIPN